MIVGSSESTPSTFRAEGGSRLEFVGKADRIIYHVLRTLPLLLANSATKKQCPSWPTGWEVMPTSSSWARAITALHHQQCKALQ